MSDACFLSILKHRRNCFRKKFGKSVVPLFSKSLGKRTKAVLNQHTLNIIRLGSFTGSMPPTSMLLQVTKAIWRLALSWTFLPTRIDQGTVSIASSKRLKLQLASKIFISGDRNMKILSTSHEACPTAHPMRPVMCWDISLQPQ